jgi:hypothetical protein
MTDAMRYSELRTNAMFDLDYCSFSDDTIQDGSLASFLSLLFSSLGV